jgi:hypothetical protein
MRDKLTVIGHSLATPAIESRWLPTGVVGWTRRVPTAAADRPVGGRRGSLRCGRAIMNNHATRLGLAGVDGSGWNSSCARK